MLRNWLIIAAAVVTLCGCQWFEDEPPHVFLISVDTLRWDALGTNGFPDPGVSPNIDALAAQGVQYWQAVSSAGTTVPSHGTMLTGLYPRQHGARSNYHGYYEKTRPVSAALTEAGYQTAAMVSYQGMVRHGDLARGFEHTNAPFSATAGEPVQAGDRTVQSAIDWLEQRDPEAPVFLFLHLFEPHSPYETSDYAEARLGDYDGFLKDGVTTEHLRRDRNEIVASPSHLAALKTLYAGEVQRADRLVGRFIEYLEATGLLDNSVIIFTADHGQAHGEDGRMGHGAAHWESVIRVPLFLVDFRQSGAEVRDDRVGTIDIAPTIADLAGIAEDFGPIGRSLRELDAEDTDRVYFAEVELRTEERERPGWYDPDALAVYSGEFKFVSRAGNDEFIELNRDDIIETPVAGDQHAAIREYLAGLVDEFRAQGLDLTPAEISDEDAEQLQGLGYVQ